MLNIVLFKLLYKLSKSDFYDCKKIIKYNGVIVYIIYDWIVKWLFFNLLCGGLENV